jgi:hypothetical protein
VPSQRRRSATQPDDSRPGRDSRSRRRSWGSTLRSVAPAHGCRDVSASARPPAVFRKLPNPVNFYRGPATDHAPTRPFYAAGHGRLRRGSWVSSPRAIRSRRVSSMRGGPRLPWASVPLSGIWTPVTRRERREPAPHSLRDRFRSLNAHGLGGGVDSAAAAMFPAGPTETPPCGDVPRRPFSISGWRLADPERSLCRTAPAPCMRLRTV